MKTQIWNLEAPLYGRFDEIMEVRPFTFQQVLSLFPSAEGHERNTNSFSHFHLRVSQCSAHLS